MSPTGDPALTIRLAHRTALAALAGCAALIMAFSLTLSQPFSESQTSRAPAPIFPYTAVALGVVAIACRQRATSNAQRGRPAVGLSIACFAFAAAIGAVGLAIVWFEQLVQPALLYTVGGAILALRSPVPLRAQTGRDVGEKRT